MNEKGKKRFDRKCGVWIKSFSRPSFPQFQARATSFELQTGHPFKGNPVFGSPCLRNDLPPVGAGLKRAPVVRRIIHPRARVVKRRRVRKNFSLLRRPRRAKFVR